MECFARKMVSQSICYSDGLEKYVFLLAQRIRSEYKAVPRGEPALSVVDRRFLVEVQLEWNIACSPTHIESNVRAE